MKKDYRIDAQAMGQEDAELAWNVIEPIWPLSTGSDRAVTLPKAWRDVTPGQLHVYAATWVEREVLNGGFWQYLYNTNADLPLKAVEGLRAIGEPKYADMLERAISALGADTFPPSRQERMRLLPEDPYDDLSKPHQQLMKKLSRLDDTFYELYGDGDEFYRHIADYVRAHPDQFIAGE